MKKSELIQLTQIIEHIVVREIRKQLPTIIAETFQNMMGKSVIAEQQRHSQDIIEQRDIEPDNPVSEQHDLKTSLKELFAGTPVMRTPDVQNEFKHYTKDSKLNQILNETKSDLRDRERLVGAAAFQGGYSPSLSMVPGFDPTQAMSNDGITEEFSFSRNVPSIPIGKPPVLREGQESMHVPMEALPENTSVLDIKQIAPPVVQRALTKNYSHMMKLIDKKKGKI